MVFVWRLVDFKELLTRRYNDITSLFANNASVTQIMMKSNSLDDIFTRYSTVVESLLRVLVDVQEKERVARSYQSELDARCLFHEEFADRIMSTLVLRWFSRLGEMLQVQG